MNLLEQAKNIVRSIFAVALDDKIFQRVEREWSVAKLLSFMRNGDQSLQNCAENSVQTAFTCLAAAVSSNENPSP